jgi:hypothetical protein
MHILATAMKELETCDGFFKLLSELFLGEKLTKHMKYFNWDRELDPQ